MKEQFLAAFKELLIVGQKHVFGQINDEVMSKGGDFILVS